MLAREYFGNWLSQQRLFLQTSTYEALEVYYRKHIIPFFYDKGLEDIKPSDVQAYVNYKLSPAGRADGGGALSMVSVRKHLAVLRQSFDYAVIMDLVPRNPCAPIRLPKNKEKPKREVFMNKQEAQIMLDGLKGSYIYPVVAITLFYGLRRSEVLGLKWSAIDFKRNLIHINHTVVKNVTIEAKDSTKTDSSNRTFELVPEIRKLLSELPRNSEYIFSWPDGTPYRPDSVTKTFQREIARLGLPRMRFHDLRHSTTSILFDMGLSLEEIRDWLGHADIETTSNIYLHYKADRKRLTADKLKGVFSL